ncbi:MAG: DNA gyrase/topoisomerase IV subunit A, partial [Bacteroidales bacterium]|nr:DNA gyrase/topoisomerase IV subunit A [Bacteroidales bacterium]
EYPRFEIMFGGKHKERGKEIIEVAEFIGIKSFKAKGKRITNYSVDNILEINPVLKKEAEKVVEEIPEIEDKPVNEEKPASDDDPAQMSLFGE